MGVSKFVLKLRLYKDEQKFEIFWECRACLKKAFRELRVSVCGRFYPNEGGVAGYGNRMRVKYTAKWGLQIAEMIFQTRSSYRIPSNIKLTFRTFTVFSPKAPKNLLSVHFSIIALTFSSLILFAFAILVSYPSPCGFFLNISGTNTPSFSILHLNSNNSWFRSTLNGWLDKSIMYFQFLQHLVNLFISQMQQLPRP